MRARITIAASLLVALATACVTARAEEPGAGLFLVKPYLQLGDAGPETLQILWHVADADADWSVEHRTAADRPWTEAGAPEGRRVAVGGIAPHRIYRATVSGLEAGRTFEYQIKKASETVFSATARARKAAGQPHRFVAFGDCGAGTPSEKAIAFQAHQAKPDFVMIAGDIVYDRGQLSEYRERFWPVYNADDPSPSSGVPLLRSTLFVAAPGNHDIATRDLGKFPDGLAYFSAWSQPLNGPLGKIGMANTPTLSGPEANRAAFLATAGSAYPRMANFSFDYGNAHWTILDANTYVDWTDESLRAWVAADLAAARGATWRFVCFHQPGFNSAKKHFTEQQMRLMAPVFEAGGVDVVFNGHVHNYQRTYPMRFAPDVDASGHFPKKSGQIAGKWTLDKSFDGRAKTKPSGVIYVITGAGGAGLYNPEQQDDRASWQEFTHTFLAKVHSLSVVDVEGRSLTLRQVSEAGEEIDRFTVTKD
jgi:3',5'-cyclic AMP phosphodiesterase CpdA